MKTLTRALQRLRADERGNIAMITVLAIVPLTLASLGAIDLTRSFAARVELQDALDAAALAAGRSNSQDDTVLQQIGSRILSQNLSGTTDFALTTSSFKLGDKGQIVASVQATFQPMLVGFGGGGPTSLSAATEVMRANNILEIAMVLDNTSSMNQTLGNNTSSKISYLKTAASSFIDTMSNASKQSSTPNSIQISLVPFSNTVRVGSTYRTATWMDQSGVSPLNNEIFTTAQGVTQVGDRWAYFDKLDAWRGCVEMRKAPYDVQDTPPTTSDPASLFTPMFAPDEQDGNNGNDYLPDPKDSKGKPLADWWAAQGDIKKYTQSSPKVTINTSKGPNAGCGLQAISRLTTDFTTLKSSVNAMVASGETNIPNGLLWGWLTLSPTAPFSDGVAYLTPKHKKIVVLMTDGDNTMMSKSTNNNSTYSAAGFVWQGRFKQADGTPLNSINSSETDRTAAMDSRMKLLCSNMKAPTNDIEIYTVGVGVSTNSRALLQACASDTSHYFDVAAGSDLTSTFQSIANQIAQLHLSK